MLNSLNYYKRFRIKKIRNPDRNLKIIKFRIPEFRIFWKPDGNTTLPLSLRSEISKKTLPLTLEKNSKKGPPFWQNFKNYSEKFKISYKSIIFHQIFQYN